MSALPTNSTNVDPIARPRPTPGDLGRLSYQLPDEPTLRVMRDLADRQHPPGMRSGLIAADLGPETVTDYLWGDVANWQTGQALFSRDDIVLRMSRGRKNDGYVFSLFDLRDQRLAVTGSVGSEPGNPGVGDDPDTPWAD